MKLSNIEKAVVLEDVFRKVMQLEAEVAVVPDKIKKMAIERRKLILAKFGFEGKRLEELKMLAVRTISKVE